MVRNTVGATINISSETALTNRIDRQAQSDSPDSPDGLKG